jgi:hypothetical protein
MKRTILRILCSALCLFGLPAWAAPPIPVMILDGESGGTYHNWRATTPVIRKELEEVGLFEVEVVTAPPADGDFSTFKPDWSKYKVIVFNYDAPSDRWPDALKASFETYMKNGGGMVTVHAADNAFYGWDAFNEMTGVGGWRGRDRAAVDGADLRQGPHLSFGNRTRCDGAEFRGQRGDAAAWCGVGGHRKGDSEGAEVVSDREYSELPGRPGGDGPELWKGPESAGHPAKGRSLGGAASSCEVECKKRNK